MQRVLHLKATVLPGGKIEIVDRELPVGESVDVVVRHPSELGEGPLNVELLEPPELPRRSALDILDEAPGHQLFKSAAEVDSYLREERASWND